MRYHVAIYRIQTGIVDVEADSLLQAIDKVKAEPPTPTTPVYDGTLEPYRVDLITTGTLTQPTLPKEDVVDDAKVDAFDTGKAENVRAYEPLKMPVIEPKKRGRQPKVVANDPSKPDAYMEGIMAKVPTPWASAQSETSPVAHVDNGGDVIEVHAKRLNRSIEDITRAIKEASDAFKIPFEEMAATKDWIGLL